MPKKPTGDDWKNFRKNPSYKDTLKETAKAFIVLYKISKPNKRVFKTATLQLVQAPMEFDGGNQRYMRARWRLPNYQYGVETHGEHPFTKKKTKELIIQAIKIAKSNNASDKALLKAVMSILDSRQDTVLMNNGDQHKAAGFIEPNGDGFIERYLSNKTRLVDRKTGLELSIRDIKKIQVEKQNSWEMAINSLKIKR